MSEEIKRQVFRWRCHPSVWPCRADPLRVVEVAEVRRCCAANSMTVPLDKAACIGWCWNLLQCQTILAPLKPCHSPHQQCLPSSERNETNGLPTRPHRKSPAVTDRRLGTRRGLGRAYERSLWYIQIATAINRI